MRCKTKNSRAKKNILSELEGFSISNNRSRITQNIFKVGIGKIQMKGKEREREINELFESEFW